MPKAETLELVYCKVADAQTELERLQNWADGLFTNEMEDWARALAKRFPKRRIEITSGMGSTSLAILPKPHSDEYLAICPDYIYGHNQLFRTLAREFLDKCDAHATARGDGRTYVDFTRDVIIDGANYAQA